ncbi:MAG: EAL domain-containing protein [Pirellulales bacterium]|nr:EAL domain-containing protein [Pirellulales bacterium]
MAYTVTATALEDMGFSGGMMVFRDITQRKKVEAQLLRLARYDQLTGLANRTFFREYLSATLAGARRRHGRFSLLLVDLDGFKSVNDRYGHDFGDLLLKQVAKRLKTSVREDDLVARLGGDEFCLVLDNLPHMEDALLVSCKILDHLAEVYRIKNREVFLSACIGVATFPDSANDCGGLIKAADMAMYSAKESGKNACRHYENHLHQKAMERHHLTLEVRRAVTHLEEFEVYFQPKLRSSDGTVTGMEALLRWFHPELGSVSPLKFIPIAENAGVISSLGNCVMERSCLLTQSLLAQSLIPEDFKLAVNVSWRQIKDGHFIRDLNRILEATGLQTRNLEIEITETTFMEDTAYAVQILRQVHHMGITIAVDDFGTGYSSLNYLSRLPIDVLKIDQSFVRGLVVDPSKDAIVRAIIALAHNLGLNVVAEGVETEEQIGFLQQYQCDFFQGYYFSKPLNEIDLTSLLALKTPLPSPLVNPA